ncbi:MAG TPA: hypothetical protein DEF51_46020, partial [Myxococcales bacterium]|nr:hypothetical protein [Myxococcales bacterium]
SVLGMRGRGGDREQEGSSKHQLHASHEHLGEHSARGQLDRPLFGAADAWVAVAAPFTTIHPMVPTTAASLLPRPGSRVGPYRIVEELGRGGMAVVYGAVRSGEGGFNRLVALKFLSPRLLEEPRFVQMFLDECRIAAHLHHPNIVQVFEVERHGELPYLVMELLQGVTFF